jgi:hypothetical protein
MLGETLSDGKRHIDGSRVLHGSLAIIAAAADAILIVQVARSVAWYISFPYQVKGWGEGYSLYNAL